MLAFATTPAGVGEVRQRVARLAELHNRAQASRAPADPVVAAGMPADTAVAAADSRPAVVEAKATTETSAGGARLVLRPVDAAHADSLRDRLRKQADAMLKSTCDRETERHAGDGQAP